MRLAAFVLGLALAGTAAAKAPSEPFHLISGRVPLDWQGPDGNTVVLAAPRGLIVVDTGRSTMHAQAILDFAKARRRPIAAIVNSHWHLDHTTGNADIRQAYPRAKVYASTAIEGALVGFLNKGRAQGDRMLADPKLPAGQRAQLLRGRDQVDHPNKLRPTHPITTDGRLNIAGRTLDVHLARFAATEGDVWIYDRKSRTAVVGDLVVGIVPFMDTACADGWLKALGEIEKVPFTTLVPGHGAVMDRADFLTWKSAFTDFIVCGRSTAPKEQCVAGWRKAAAKFIDDEHRTYVGEAAAYYIDTRLRSSPEEQQRYCKPLTAD